MMDASKYRIGYFNPPVEEGHIYRWSQRDHIEKAPIWCSVDLRDGNQALIVPMGLKEKLEFFQLLVRIGFKEIEVGFPASSDTEFEFVRTLIEQKLIPEDVTIQVLTQCREHIIRRTFEAIQGAPKAIIHFYNSTSRIQREQVFKKSKEEIKKIATDSAVLIKRLSLEYEGDFRFEYSPESFTGTEPEFAVEVCNAVLDILQPTRQRPVIINLPDTVQMSMPHIYANQMEWCSDHLKYRRNVILSTHPHNDRGTGVAAAELAVLAGAQRIECCLFGNGERTGNADAITLAMNLYTHGVDPGLDFSDMPGISETYERCTRMRIFERSPYAGSLVFAAFSGSHQDAIAKGMIHYRASGQHEWNCPYIPLDPTDINRTYDADVIRINSQSGKGGISFLLEQNYGYFLPARMREAFGYQVKEISDYLHKELTVSEVYEVFCANYLNRLIPLHVSDVHFWQVKGTKNSFRTVITIHKGDWSIEVRGHGNGRLDAVANALRTNLNLQFKLIHYSEHSLAESTQSLACSYIGLEWAGSKRITWGAGTDDDIIGAGIRALVSAINSGMKENKIE